MTGTIKYILSQVLYIVFCFHSLVYSADSFCQKDIPIPQKSSPHVVSTSLQFLQRNGLWQLYFQTMNVYPQSQGITLGFDPIYMGSIVIPLGSYVQEDGARFFVSPLQYIYQLDLVAKKSDQNIPALLIPYPQSEIELSQQNKTLEANLYKNMFEESIFEIESERHLQTLYHFLNIASISFALFGVIVWILIRFYRSSGVQKYCARYRKRERILRSINKAQNISCNTPQLDWGLLVSIFKEAFSSDIHASETVNEMRQKKLSGVSKANLNEWYTILENNRYAEYSHNSRGQFQRAVQMLIQILSSSIRKE